MSSRKLRIVSLMVVFTAVLAPCSWLVDDAVAQDVLDEGVVASVNGKEITKIAVEIIAAQMQNDADDNVSRSSIVDQLVDLAILSQAAESDSLHQDPAIIEAVKLQYEQTLANAFIGILSNSIEVTDAEIREEYEMQVSNIEPTEFNARHILLNTEDEAIKVIEQLEAGSEFSDLAIEFSTDSSAESGGDLGWTSLESYIPEFKKAVESMEVGAQSTEPFETEFGWHVVKLLDTRGPPPPKYQDVKSELKGAIINRKVNDRVRELRAKSIVIVRDLQ
jgi:peptidyl-prolyl cis-trans isomerase C